MIATLHIIATGKYTRFVQQLIDSAELFFLPGLETCYLIHTDNPNCLPSEDLSRIFRPIFFHLIRHEPWPYPTLHRYRTIITSRNSSQLIQSPAFSPPNHYYIDVDMRFVRPVGPEIIKPLVGVQHPGYLHTPPQYLPLERDPSSHFFVSTHNPYPTYFAGGFQGGGLYLNACRKLMEMIDAERRDNNRFPVWHDESAWNWYLRNTQNPVTVLPADYCRPEPGNETSRILALNKNG
jgi:hypothetical protein